MTGSRTAKLCQIFNGEPGGLDFGDDDFVGFLQQGNALRGDFAEDADSETGAGKGLAAGTSSGMPRSRPMRRTSSLNKSQEGLDELELHALGQAAHVVMALDGLTGAFDAGGFDDVRVESSLHQPFDAAGFFGDAVGFVVKDGDELGADSLSLCLRVGDAGELVEKAAAGVYGDDVEAELATKILLHGAELVFAQDAVVDEDAGELRANGLVNEDGGDGGIDSAGEATDDVAVADLLANLRETVVSMK